MSDKIVLVVDDEKNIRLTVSQVLDSLEYPVETAINGQEVLKKLDNPQLALILLDLRLPGMDGMEVLRQVRKTRPDIRVIIMTAYGTVESAVEAIKLGAVDFISKPFTPDQIRTLVRKVLNRESLPEEHPDDYGMNLELARKCITNLFFEAALEYIKKAISMDPSHAEAFNLMGILHEIQGDVLEANKNYRAALALDPTYKPAAHNLDRALRERGKETIAWGEESNHKKKS
jgi:DNA-binding NtrC family response regulator